MVRSVGMCSDFLDIGGEGGGGVWMCVGVRRRESIYRPCTLLNG